MLGKREGFQVQIQLFESLLKIAVRENTCIPFQNNLSTRILEKDHYVPDYPNINDSNKLSVS